MTHAHFLLFSPLTFASFFVLCAQPLFARFLSFVNWPAWYACRFLMPKSAKSTYSGIKVHIFS